MVICWACQSGQSEGKNTFQDGIGMGVTLDCFRWAGCLTHRGGRRGAGDLSESELTLTWAAGRGALGQLLPEHRTSKSGAAWSAYAGHCWPHRLLACLSLGGSYWLACLVLLGLEISLDCTLKLVNLEFLHARKILRMAELREGKRAPYPKSDYMVFSPNNWKLSSFFSLYPSPLSVDREC